MNTGLDLSWPCSVSVNHRQPKLKLWAMIILRNSGQGANITVCKGTFTIRFRRYKYWKVLNRNDIPCFQGVLSIVCFLFCADLRPF